MRHHKETLSTVEPLYVNPNCGLASPLKGKQMMFSLFYFSTVDELLDANKYRLYLEGAKFADRHPDAKHLKKSASVKRAAWRSRKRNAPSTLCTVH